VEEVECTHLVILLIVTVDMEDTSLRVVVGRLLPDNNSTTTKVSNSLHGTFPAEGQSVEEVTTQAASMVTTGLLEVINEAYRLTLEAWPPLQVTDKIST
jgi:hypothetical protein